MHPDPKVFSDRLRSGKSILVGEAFIFRLDSGQHFTQILIYGIIKSKDLVDPFKIL